MSYFHGRADLPCQGCADLQRERDEARAALAAAEKKADEYAGIAYRAGQDCDHFREELRLARVMVGEARARAEGTEADLFAARQRIADLTGERDAERHRAEKAEAIARRVLWERHGHDGLYGDDGEMQCGRCLIDFKRLPLDEIEDALAAVPRAAIDRALAPAPPGEEKAAFGCGHPWDDDALTENGGDGCRICGWEFARRLAAEGATERLLALLAAPPAAGPAKEER